MRLFRGTIYVVFIALMVFFAVCMAVGIVSNLRWRHDDMDLPVNPPESSDNFSPLELRDCMSALDRMHTELWHKLHDALLGTEGRDALLASWKTWSRSWRKRFEKLGVSCSLTEYRYEGNPILGSMSEIYHLLDYFQRQHTRLVKRYLTENARPLSTLHALFPRVERQIERLEAAPVDTP